MPRSTNNPATRARRKKILKAAKGFRGTRSTQARIAKQAVIRAGVFAYRDRKARKRDFRKLWIARINAGARQHGLSYSRFMNGVKRANLDLNRKMLAEIAATDEAGFAQIVDQVKAALDSAS
jgi:large subunit ribosomal protein L20